MNYLIITGRVIRASKRVASKKFRKRAIGMAIRKFPNQIFEVLKVLN